MQKEKGFTDNWLQPTGTQERLLRQYAGCKRFAWNRALSQGWGELGRQLAYKQSWAGGRVAYQSEAYSSQQCPACEYTSPLNRKTQEMFACASPRCGFSANADQVAAANQLGKVLSSDKGVALLASGYRASVNSLWSGRSWDSATKQEPIEEAAQCVQPQ